MMLFMRQSEQNPRQIWPVSQVIKSVDITSVHREHVKQDIDSGVKSRKQQPFILSVIISVDIGVQSDI